MSILLIFQVNYNISNKQMKKWFVNKAVTMKKATETRKQKPTKCWDRHDYCLLLISVLQYFVAKPLLATTACRRWGIEWTSFAWITWSNASPGLENCCFQFSLIFGMLCAQCSLHKYRTYAQSGLNRVIDWAIVALLTFLGDKLLVSLW